MIKQAAVDIQACLEKGDLDEFARLLHYSWQEKRKLAPGLSNSFIDECYTLALQCGATGGKITGAGGGGFLLLYCNEQAQEAVTLALEAQGVKRMNFHFDQQGARILLNVTHLDDRCAPYTKSLV
jgi:D-glycero-alpha-D-manno-heptose-7-phosphate kinase